jgi:hypothetical protein
VEAGRSTGIRDGVVRMAVDKTKGHPYLFMFVLHETLNKLAGRRVITTKQFTKSGPSSPRTNR